MPCEHTGKAGFSFVKRGTREIEVMHVLNLETYSVSM